MKIPLTLNGVKMPFESDIATLYEKCGSKHILPFVGGAYSQPDPDHFRLVVVGINSYISPPDWPKNDQELQGWFRRWWQQAGHGRTSGTRPDTYLYYVRAFKEADMLARALCTTSNCVGLQYDGAPETKRGFYATNAIKVYTGEEHKRSNLIPGSYIESFAPTWRSELDLMAQYACLPHLIIVFAKGNIWDLHVRSLSPVANSGAFTVTKCESARGHDASRIWLDSGHTLLLVRLAHPRPRFPRPQPRNAAWLLADAEFRQFAEIATPT
jgi:hypothetical protein